MESGEGIVKASHSFRLPRIPSDPEMDDIGDVLGSICGSCFASLFKCCCCCFKCFVNDSTLPASINSQDDHDVSVINSTTLQYTSFRDNSTTPSTSTPKSPLSQTFASSEDDVPP